MFPICWRVWTILLLTDRNPYHDLALSTLEKFAKALEVDIRAIDRDRPSEASSAPSRVLHGVGRVCELSWRPQGSPLLYAGWIGLRRRSIVASCLGDRQESLGGS